MSGIIEQREGIISLHEMCFTTTHGVYASEKIIPQRFIVDVDIYSRFPSRDVLAETVDYSVLAEQIEDVVNSQSVNLIETLAENIAELCLLNNLVSAVRVKVTKPDAPVKIGAKVSVEIRRTK